MVVWILRNIYGCILLSVIVINGCMSITKDLPFYYILNCNCDEWLYEYYERSTIVLYLMLMNMNGCMGITRDLLLYCIEH
jgi:hypothetical protein